MRGSPFGTITRRRDRAEKPKGLGAQKCLGEIRAARKQWDDTRRSAAEGEEGLIHGGRI